MRLRKRIRECAAHRSAHGHPFFLGSLQEKDSRGICINRPAKPSFENRAGPSVASGACGFERAARQTELRRNPTAAQESGLFGHVSAKQTELNSEIVRIT